MKLSELKKRIENEISHLNRNTALSVKFLNTQQTISINDQQQFWAASVIKIPIACEVFKQVNAQNLQLDTRYTLTEENIVEGTGVVKLMDRKDEFTLLDLVTLMLVISDNTATNQIIDIICWENVGIYMSAQGLSNTTFKHKMMIKAGRGPNLTTASDVSILLEKLYNNSIAGSTQIIEILKHQYDRTRLPLLIPNDIEIAHKPGALPEAVHDVGIVYTTNPFIFVFLSDDQKDKQLTVSVLAKCARLCYEFTQM